MDCIKISVVVPIFKSEDYLVRTIKSLIYQTWKEIEIILVNDGSPDNSGDICDSYAKIDDRIKVIHQLNQGAAHAMRNGANHATGDYIMFLDGDDWIEINTLEKAINKIMLYNPDIIFWSYYKNTINSEVPIKSLFDKDIFFIGDELVNLKRRLVGLVGKELEQPTRTDAISSGWGKLYRKELITNNHFCLVDENDNENFDVVLNIIAFHNAKKVYYMYDYFNHYWISNTNSITKNHGLKLLDKYNIMFDNIEKYLKEKNYSDIYFIALRNRIALSMINITLSVTGFNNSSSLVLQYKTINFALLNPKYIDAIKNLEFKYFSLTWKIFFTCCKYRLTPFIFLFGKLIQVFK
ncbi:MAG: glycosyltransferase [Saprospiraceae bacterium]|nr:glycosyltransferase [Saprospiraceae bacterium]